ncbi:MAG: diguanylate cyclase, partial [Actinomycetes bacterium]
KYPVLDDLEVPPSFLENWQMTVDLLADIAGVSASLIMRVHEQEIEVLVSSRSKGNVYEPGERAPLDTGLYCETVMSTRRRLLVPNALKDPDWDHNPDIKLGMVSYCGLPLTLPTGELFGTICILDSHENPYSQQVRALLERCRDSILLSLKQVYDANRARRMADEAEVALDELAKVSGYTRSLIEASLDPLVTISVDGVITDANAATETMTGLTRGTLIGSDFTTYFTEPERARAGYQQAFAEGSVTDYPLAIRHTSGTIADVLYNAAIYRDAHGDVAGVVATARDITDRKAAEAALRESRAQLEQAQRIAHVGSWTLDLATNHSTVSDEMYLMLGLDPASPMQSYTEFERLFTPQSWQRLSTAVSRSPKAGASWEMELEMVRPDGTRGWMLARGEAVRDAVGAVVGFAGVAMDITDRKVASDALHMLATHDSLTGLANRVTLLDEISRALNSGRRSGRATAVLMMDLDHFKDVNDTLGHAAGDDLLVAAGTRIREVVRAGDLVARFGGDEFVILL